METVGIALALAGGLVGAPIFCFILARVVRRFPRVASVAFWAAVPLVLLYASEVLLVLTRGVLSTRALIGPLSSLNTAERSHIAAHRTQVAASETSFANSRFVTLDNCRKFLLPKRLT